MWSEAHEALRKDTGMALPATRRGDRVRAWCVRDDGEGLVYVYHATSKGRAIGAHVKETGLTFGEVLATTRTRRCPAMDNLPVDNWHLLVTGTVQYVESCCLGCGATIYASELERPDGEEPVLHEEATGEVWCSRSCYEAFRGVA